MTHSEIAKMLGAVATPDPDYCPKPIIYWKQKVRNKQEYTHYYYYPLVGKLFLNEKFPDKDTELYRYQQSNADQTILIPSSSYGGIFQYMKYYPEYECLEMAFIHMPVDKLKKENRNPPKRTFEFKSFWLGYKTYLFKNDPFPYDVHGEVAYPNNQKPYYNSRVGYQLRYAVEEGGIIRTGKSCAEWRKFCGAPDTGEVYNSVEFETGYGREDYYKNMVDRPKSKATAKMDDVMSEHLTNWATLAIKYPAIIEDDGCWPRYVRGNIIFCEKIKNGVVLRKLKRDYDLATTGKGTYEDPQTFTSEPIRIYFKKNENPKIMKWVDARKRYEACLSEYHLDSYGYDFVNQDEFLKSDILSNIPAEEIAKECNANHVIASLHNHLKMPILMKFKTEYPAIYDHIGAGRTKEVRYTLGSIFGYSRTGKDSLICKKSTTPEEIVGVSKNVLKAMDKLLDEVKNVGEIQCINSILHTDYKKLYTNEEYYKDDCYNILKNVDTIVNRYPEGSRITYVSAAAYAYYIIPGSPEIATARSLFGSIRKYYLNEEQKELMSELMKISPDKFVYTLEMLERITEVYRKKPDPEVFKMRTYEDVIEMYSKC